MKYLIFLNILFLIFTMPSAAWAQDLLTHDPKGLFVENDLPQWQRSVADVKVTASRLLAMNADLREDNERLDQEVQRLGQQVLDQKQKNRQAAELLEERKAELRRPVKEDQLRTMFVDLEDVIAQKRSTQNTLIEQKNGLDSMIDAHEQQIRALEIEQKTLLQRQAELSSEKVLDDMRSDIIQLKAEIADQQAEEKRIQDQLKLLVKPKEPVSSQEDQKLQGKIAAVRMRILRAEEEKKALQSRLSQAEQALSAASRKGGDSTKYARAIEKKRMLNEKIYALEQELRAVQESGPDMSGSLKEEVETGEKKNQFIVEQIEELRENIAILDYKISSLERYRSRSRTQNRR